MFGKAKIFLLLLCTCRGLLVVRAFKVCLAANLEATGNGVLPIDQDSLVLSAEELVRMLGSFQDLVWRQA